MATYFIVSGIVLVLHFMFDYIYYVVDIDYPNLTPRRTFIFLVRSIFWPITLGVLIIISMVYFYYYMTKK